MTDQEIAGLGPAFARYLDRYRDGFLQKWKAGHFDNYCRGRLSDLPRKSVGPIARACETAARTLKEFLVTADGSHEVARETPATHGRGTRRVALRPAGNGRGDRRDPLREEGRPDAGRATPVRGCLGQIVTGIVAVRVGAATGSFQALRDTDLFLPEVWDADRPRCRAAGIPDTARYRPEWQIAY